jgi:hypothetical protein
MAARTVFYLNHNKENKRDWEFKEKGDKNPIFTSSNKETILKKAIALARKEELSQILIQNKYGDWQEERTYGEDPRRYPG